MKLQAIPCFKNRSEKLNAIDFNAREGQVFGHTLQEFLERTKLAENCVNKVNSHADRFLLEKVFVILQINVKGLWVHRVVAIENESPAIRGIRWCQKNCPPRLLSLNEKTRISASTVI
jgi:hypothetical protein